jgi:hypothetical protein
MFPALCWVMAGVIVIFLAGCLWRRKAPHDTPLVLTGASPHPVRDPVVQRPGQALDLFRADAADPFRLFDLAQRRPGGADREEQVRIGVEAGGILTPVRVHGHHG